MPEPIIYFIRNRVTGKFYIGQSRQGLDRRKSEHIYRLNLGERDHKLYRSMRKHGIENFDFEVLYRCRDASELDAMETFFVASANSFNRGYNMTCGGDGVSDETREKLRAIFTGRKITWYDKILASRLSNPNRKHPRDYVAKGAANSKAGAYLVRFPDGRETRIVGLRAFCKEHSLTHNLMIATLNGLQRHHKGYALLARFNDHPEGEYGQAAGNGAHPATLAG